MNCVIETNYWNTQVNRSIMKKTENSPRSYSAVQANAADKAADEGSSKSVKKESVVDEYKRKHPEDASHVNGQVNAGKKVISKNGAEDVSREEMTMEEYKSFITGLLNTIPFDSTRLNDREIINISDKGWEQMKNDPEYEAWILGYTVENRSVRNPFAGLMGASGSLSIENFGDSIEEHHGMGIPMSSLGGSPGEEDDEESWWQKRHKKIEELMKEAIQKAQAKAREQSAFARQESLKHQIESGQRLRSFFLEGEEGGKETGETASFITLGNASAAVAAYEGMLGMMGE